MLVMTDVSVVSAMAGRGGRLDHEPVDEFRRQVLGVRRGPAVSEQEDLVSRLQSRRHRLDHGHDPVQILVDESSP